VVAEEVAVLQEAQAPLIKVLMVVILGRVLLAQVVVVLRRLGQTQLPIIQVAQEAQAIIPILRVQQYKDLAVAAEVQIALRGEQEAQEAQEGVAPAELILLMERLERPWPEVVAVVVVQQLFLVAQAALVFSSSVSQILPQRYSHQA